MTNRGSESASMYTLKVSNKTEILMQEIETNISFSLYGYIAIHLHQLSTRWFCAYFH